MQQEMMLDQLFSGWLNSSENTPEVEEKREQEKAVWEPWMHSEMDRVMDLLGFIVLKKMDELDENYVKKLELKALKESGENVFQQELEDGEFKTYYKKYTDFRNNWQRLYPDHCEFEDISKIRCMQYTRGPLPRFVFKGPLPRTLQIFSVKIVGTSHQGGPNWPLQVYGLIAVRDFVDAQRNVIFNRERDECQLITKEDPYLLMTGPTRSVVINTNEMMGPVTMEAELKVKGAVESEDRYLILEAKPSPCLFVPRSAGSVELEPFELAGPHSRKLEISLGAIANSVEATIFIQVIDGTWPIGFHGQFAACTASINRKKAILVEFGDDNVPPSDDGGMKLSRRVISVESSGMLVVSLKAWKGDEVMEGEVGFNAARRGRSFGTLKLGPCSIEVLVAWSLVRPYREELVPADWLSLCNFEACHQDG